jgi:hypothetical protein
MICSYAGNMTKSCEECFFAERGMCEVFKETERLKALVASLEKQIPKEENRYPFERDSL